MFRTFFSCFRWKAFIFSSSVRVSVHVLQLYSSMDFTRDLLSFILVVVLSLYSFHPHVVKLVEGCGG